MIYEWVKKYIGIPFISNGRTLEGCDCYGLVRLVLRNEYGITLPELSNDYSNALNIKETARLLGITTNNVGVTRHIAKEKLKELLAARGKEGESHE